MQLRAAFIVALLVASVPASVLAAGSGWRAPALAADVSDALRTVIENADRLYAARDKGDQGVQALDALRAAAKANPESWDVHWRLARAAFWVSEGLPAKAKSERRAIAVEGWKAGEKARDLKPDAPEGPYFMALCIGEYSHSIGIITALREGIEAKFRDPLLAVSKKAPKVDHGGVWNALGRYKFELPWPKQDVDASIKFLRKAIEVNPDNLRARVFLAESLEDRDDDDDVTEAKKLLTQVAKAPANRYDPPEEQRARSLARALARRLEWKIEGL